MANYVQPDYRIPSAPGVTVQPHQAGATSGNPLSLSWPVPRYIDPVTVKDDPQGTIVAGKSGKGSPG